MVVKKGIIENRMKMNDFVAIDFETANHRRTSVCSVGVVVVRDGEVVDKVYRLIRPRPNFYLDFTTRIHGITFEDTLEAPDFPTVWRDVEQLIGGLPLVAHNSVFDEGCLRSVYELYGMNYPSYEIFCTYRAAKKIYPGLINHKLPTVAFHCGFDLQNHHNALADAEACAAIALMVFGNKI